LPKNFIYFCPINPRTLLRSVWNFSNMDLWLPYCFGDLCVVTGNVWIRPRLVDTWTKHQTFNSFSLIQPPARSQGQGGILSNHVSRTLEARWSFWSPRFRKVSTSVFEIQSARGRRISRIALHHSNTLPYLSSDSVSSLGYRWHCENLRSSILAGPCPLFNARDHKTKLRT